MWTKRQDEKAAVGKLIDQRLRHLFGCRGDDDAIERRAMSRAFEAVTDDDLDIRISGPIQRLARVLGERAAGT